MPIYAKTNNNEYNKIIDIFDTNGIDITDVYHDDQLVYTVSKDILGSTELYYNTNRYDITNFRVYGNTLQNGVPSPEAPVDAVGCGVRTGNLFDAEFVQGGVLTDGSITNATSRARAKVYVRPNETYSFSCNAPTRIIYAYGNDDAPIRIMFDDPRGTDVASFTAPEGTAYVWICVMNEGGTGTILPSSVETPMLNLGSTALPYEPYGFKLPLTVNATEYPIYLGQVESTRRIKKLVLTGKESWFEFGAENPSRFITYAIADRRRHIAPLCTHYIGSTVTNYSGLSNGYISVNTTPSNNNRPRTTIHDDRFLTTNEFKSYLATQYAAGIPVTIWYVLAEPETAVVNEPLHKIGNYADSINIVQSNSQLKLDIGENNISIPTTVPPSNMELQAKGGISVSGTSSLQITRKSEYLSDYKISGDTLQDGTPSPDMPIEVAGCGVRTGNLFDKSAALVGYEIINNYISPNASWAVSDYIPVEQGNYYIAANSGAPVLEYTEIGGAATRAQYGIIGGYYTPSANTKFIRINCLLSRINSIMLNLGSTALPYEPYGFKLPITVNGTEYPIYLGTVPTTRRVKKLVLTGKENITKAASNPVFTMQLSGGNTPLSESGVSTLSTHYLAQNNVAGTGNVGDLCICIRRGYSTMYIGDTRYDNAADFKSYLAAQYAAGTPVTVWYVLAEPETAVVNEPLMKIGDYADTISFAQAGVTIPTVNGTNVLDMTSPVKPSEVYIKGKGIKPTGYGQLTDVNGVNVLDKDGRPIYVHGQ